MLWIYGEYEGDIKCKVLFFYKKDWNVRYYLFFRDKIV